MCIMFMNTNRCTLAGQSGGFWIENGECMLHAHYLPQKTHAQEQIMWAHPDAQFNKEGIGAGAFFIGFNRSYLRPEFLKNSHKIIKRFSITH